MAWTETCKIAFKMDADFFVKTQKGQQNRTKVLKKLSTESGIPFNTLKRWYYDKEKEKEDKLNSIRNDTTHETTENVEDIETDSPDSPDEQVIPVCTKCGENPVEKHKKTGKYVGPDSKYFGLCGSCRKKAKIIGDSIKLANEEEQGEWVICPECRHNFLIPNKE